MLRSGKVSGIVLVGCLTVLAAGCRKPQPASSQAATNSHRYDVRGKVVSVDAKDGVISMDTQAIPGVMEAMTMAYNLRDPWAAQELHPGDEIHATLDTSSGRAELSGITITHQAVLDTPPARQYNVPQVGQTVPDFTLRNQDGRIIHLRQYRGKVLMLTFIFTRCPSPKYCPLMNQNFAAINKQLAADPALYDHTHLLSISFDPQYDTPAVLRRYGESYVGHNQKDGFAHWDFAAPSEKELASLLQWFDVGVTRQNGGVTQHTLSTVIIGPEGRVRYWYPSNDWTPAMAIRDIKTVLQQESGKPAPANR